MKRIVAVIALTLAAGGLAERTAFADPLPAPVATTPSLVAVTPPALAPTPPVEAHTDTPLVVRPSKPLTLQEPSAPSGHGWQILALAGAAGVGFWLWKRRGRRPIASLGSPLRIVRRAAVGIRSELLVVEVDGQRLLIGVTPSAIQTLATLSGIEDDAEVDELARDADGGPAPQLGDRFASILASARKSTAFEGRPRTATQGSPARTSPKAPVTPVEGQARGLMALGTRE